MSHDSKRRMVVVLAAVLLPCVALTAIALRMLHQERELTLRRDAEMQRTAVLQRGLALQRRLDRIQPNDRAVILAAPVLNGALQFPWDHPHDARAQYAKKNPRELAQLDLRIQDEEGMPLAVYAAERLGVKLNVNVIPELSPVALYGLLHVGNDTAVVRERLRRAESLVRLRNEYGSLLSSDPGQSTWFLYGAAPWLVRFDSTRALVLDADRAFASAGIQLVSADRGEPLGPAFSGLYARTTVTTQTEPRTPLLLLVLVLTIALAVMSAYIAWRDVNRETRAARMRTQFVSSVSHELKTPLTAIRMYSDMLRMNATLPAAKRDEYLSTIGHESERLSRLINNVLDFARIERGEKQYRLEDVDLRDVAHEIARSMAYPIAQSGFELNVHVADGIPSVQADRDALSQAIINLLSNAMKFSRDDKHIELNIARENGHALIAVSDHGRGIAAQEQARVFDEYYRTPDAEADGIPGTGLGLALVDHVARNHGGDVIIESSRGTGSRFTIRLPVRTA